MSNKFQQWISSELKEIKKNNLHRILTEIDSSMSPEIIINKKKYIQFASNNYLGLTINSKIKNHSIKSINKFGTGTGGSRLVTGTSSLHCDLENVIAKFKKTQEPNIRTLQKLFFRKD